MPSLDEEVVLVVFDEAVAGELDDHFAEDLEHSVAIDLGRWRRRTVGQRVLERVTTLASPWM